MSAEDPTPIPPSEPRSDPEAEFSSAPSASEPVHSEPVHSEPGHSEPVTIRSDDRTWAMVAHLAGVVSSVLFPVVVSLVIFYVKKDESEFIADQAKEAVNFQVSIILATIVSVLMIPLCGVGIFLGAAVALASLVFAIIGAIKSYDGERYRYPFSLRMF